MGRSRCEVLDAAAGTAERRMIMAEYIEREAAMYIAFKCPFFSDSLMEEIKAIPTADVAPVAAWAVD